MCEDEPTLPSHAPFPDDVISRFERGAGAGGRSIRFRAAFF